MAIANTDNLMKDIPKDDFKYFWQRYVGYKVWLRLLTRKGIV